MKLKAICPFCSEQNIVEVVEKDYQAWVSGAYIQDAFPYLSSEKRELIKTGICEPCWNLTMGDCV